MVLMPDKEDVKKVKDLSLKGVEVSDSHISFLSPQIYITEMRV